MQNATENDLFAQNEDLKSEIDLIRADKSIDPILKQILVDGKKVLIRQNSTLIDISRLQAWKDGRAKWDHRWEWFIRVLLAAAATCMIGSLFKSKQ